MPDYEFSTLFACIVLGTLFLFYKLWQVRTGKVEINSIDAAELRRKRFEKLSTPGDLNQRWQEQFVSGGLSDALRTWRSLEFPATVLMVVIEDQGVASLKLQQYVWASPDMAEIIRPHPTSTDEVLAVRCQAGSRDAAFIQEVFHLGKDVTERLPLVFFLYGKPEVVMFHTGENIRSQDFLRHLRDLQRRKQQQWEALGWVEPNQAKETPMDFKILDRDIGLTVTSKKLEDDRTHLDPMVLCLTGGMQISLKDNPMDGRTLSDCNVQKEYSSPLLLSLREGIGRQGCHPICRDLRHDCHRIFLLSLREGMQLSMKTLADKAITLWIETSGATDSQSKDDRTLPDSNIQKEYTLLRRVQICMKTLVYVWQLDGRTLSNCIFLLLGLRESMQILVKTLNAMAITLYVKTSDTIATEPLLQGLFEGIQAIVKTFPGKTIALFAETSDAIDYVLSQLLTRSLAYIHAKIGISTKTMCLLGMAGCATGAPDYHDILGQTSSH